MWDTWSALSLLTEAPHSAPDRSPRLFCSWHKAVCSCGFYLCPHKNASPTSMGAGLIDPPAPAAVGPQQCSVECTPQSAGRGSEPCLPGQVKGPPTPDSSPPVEEHRPH